MRSNCFLIRSLVGWTERLDASSVAAVGRLEKHLALGHVASVEEGFRIADELLAEFARERTQTDITIEPIDVADTPYLGFQVGDTVTVEGVEHRVLGITVAEDADTGRAIFVPTLNADIVLGWEERIWLADRKMLPGTNNGKWKAAQPIVPVAVSRARAPRQCEPVTYAESFNKADGVLGPDITWTDQAPGWGAGFVRSNQFSRDSSAETGNVGSLAIPECCTDDQYAEVTLSEWTAPKQTSDDFGLMLRHSGPFARGYLLEVHMTGAWHIGVGNLSGWDTVAVDIDPFPDLLVPGDTIRFEVAGDTLRWLYNDVEIASATDTTWQSGGYRCGLYSQCVTAGTLRLDNFGYGDL